MHAVQLGLAYPKLVALDAALLILLPEPMERARKIAKLLRAPFPVLADPDRAVFRRFGYRRIWPLQQSGTTLVDRDGAIAYVRRAASPRRALDLAALMQAVEAAQV